MSTPPVRPPSGTSPARAAEQDSFGALRSRVIRYLQCPDLVNESNIACVYKALRDYMHQAVPDGVYEQFYQMLGFELPPGSGQIVEAIHLIFNAAQNLSHAFPTSFAVNKMLHFACRSSGGQKARLIEVGCGRGFLLHLFEQARGKNTALDLVGIELWPLEVVEKARELLVRALEKGESLDMRLEGKPVGLTVKGKIALPMHSHREDCCSDPLKHVELSSRNSVEVIRAISLLPGFSPLCETPIQKKSSEQEVLESVKTDARKGNATLLISWFHHENQGEFSKILRTFYEAGGERVIVIGDFILTAFLQSVAHPGKEAVSQTQEGSWHLQSELDWQKEIFEMGLMTGNRDHKIRFYERKGTRSPARDQPVNRAAAGSAAAAASGSATQVAESPTGSKAPTE